MKELIFFYVMLTFIAISAFTAAISAYKTSRVKPIRVQELIIVVNSGDNAEAILDVLQDIMSVD